MSNVEINWDSYPLNGYVSGTSECAVADGFEMPVPTRERDWIERQFGSVPAPNPRSDKLEVEIPLRIFAASEDLIYAEHGKIRQKITKTESLAHIGGTELTFQFNSSTYATSVYVLGGDITKVQIDGKHIGGLVGDCTLKLYCLPQFLGPERLVASGRVPAGMQFADLTVGSLLGDMPGPMRLKITNQGSVGQQFAMMGAQWRDAVSGNSMVLGASTFDYSTAPLNGSYTAAVNEVQTATKSGTISGGTFTLTYEGQTTTSLAYNASTATVQTAIEALSTVGTGNIAVSGSALSSGNMVFTFQGSLGGIDASLIVLNSSLTGGGSAPVTQTTQGVSGYVANTSLQSSWSDFMRTADQTDTGSYQLKALVVTSAAAGMCRVRAAISIGDSSRYTVNVAASVPASGAAVLVDLGPVHAKKRVSSGSFRWNATIAAKTVDTTVGTYCRILKIVKVPIESGVAVVKTPTNNRKSLVLSDDFNQSAGSYTGKSMDLGGSVSGGGDADDFTIDTTNDLLQRTAVSDASGTGRYVYAGSNMTDCCVTLTLESSGGGSPSSATPKYGAILRWVDANNFLVVGAGYNTSEGAYKVTVWKKISGSFSVIAQGGYFATLAGGTAGEVFEGTLTARVQSDGSFLVAGGLRVPTISGRDSALATGGALASGKCGIYDEASDGSAGTRTYDNFRAYGIPTIDAAAFPSRSLQWQPDGTVEREASGGTYYAYAAGQQRVGLPLLGPAGSESLTNRITLGVADLNPDYAATGAQPAAYDYEIYHRPAYSLGRTDA